MDRAVIISNNRRPPVSRSPRQDASYVRRLPWETVRRELPALSEWLRLGDTLSRAVFVTRINIAHKYGDPQDGISICIPLSLMEPAVGNDIGSVAFSVPSSGHPKRRKGHRTLGDSGKDSSGVARAIAGHELLELSKSDAG